MSFVNVTCPSGPACPAARTGIANTARAPIVTRTFRRPNLQPLFHVAFIVTSILLIKLTRPTNEPSTPEYRYLPKRIVSSASTCDKRHERTFSGSGTRVRRFDEGSGWRVPADLVHVPRVDYWTCTRAPRERVGAPAEALPRVLFETYCVTRNNERAEDEQPAARRGRSICSRAETLGAPR